jgi:hypothetical protein
MSNSPFDEVEAATKLGYAGQRFESIAPYALEGVYWVKIGSPEKKIGRPVIVRQGHVVADRGYAVGVAWLRELAARNDPSLDTTVVPQVLRWYEALPTGWNENFQFDPLTNERGVVTLHPIEVKLVSGTYVPPRPRTQPPVSPGTPSPLSDPFDPSTGRGTGRSAIAPPSAAPPSSGGPAGPGESAGVGGGQRPSRATLREVDGKFTWLLETYDTSTKQWREELRDPAE